MYPAYVHWDEISLFSFSCDVYNEVYEPTHD